MVLLIKKIKNEEIIDIYMFNLYDLSKINVIK
jgi:hypothetical protein